MILKTMDGVVIPVSRREADLIMAAIEQKRGHVQVRGALLPCSSIAIYPDEFWADREKQGRLHDGTRVVREFGRWVDARDPKVHISWEHYPELANDEVLTESEWVKGGLDALAPGEERARLYVEAIHNRNVGLIENGEQAALT